MAFDINSVFIVGRLTRDPELSYTNSQKAICKFSVANGRGKDEVSFFDVITWEKVATSCGQYLKKGSQFVINGKLQQNRFTDKDGNNRSKIEIVGVNVQFVGAKSDSQSSPPPVKSFDDQVLDGSEEVPF